jgi:hypothetical protein
MYVSFVSRSPIPSFDLRELTDWPAGVVRLDLIREEKKEKETT